MTPKRKLIFLQWLRAVAAFSVVVAHLFEETEHRFAGDYTRWTTQFSYWSFGVDIFFVISGFIMYYIIAESPGGFKQSASFIEARVLRIVPIYWLYTTLYLVLSVKADHLLRKHGLSLFFILASYFFIPAERPGTGLYSPLFAGGWTLNYEVIFYALCATVILFFPSRKLLLISIVIVVAVLVGFSLPRAIQSVPWYYTRSTILEFLYGAIIARLFIKRADKLPLLVGLGAIIVGGIIWQVTAVLWSAWEPLQNIRGFTWGIGAMLVVGGVALSPRISKAIDAFGPSHIITRVGDASYSLYLCHMFAIRICTLMLPRQPSIGIMIIYWVLGLSLSVVLALISYRFIEKPILAYSVALRKKLNRPRRIRSEAS